MPQIFQFDYEEMKQLVQIERKSYPAVFHIINKRYEIRPYGLSPRSVERYCTSNGITSRSGLSDKEVYDAVAKGSEDAGPTYGYR